MNILAMDIGGTRCRMAWCLVESGQYRLHKTIEIPTRQQGIHDFNTLLDACFNACPADFPALAQFDVLGIAIAGPVVGDQAFPPNIDWELDLSACQSLPRTFLLNDFAAQGYALSTSYASDGLIMIRQASASGNISAIVGAGTGLGHCLLINHGDNVQVIASEAGQASFTFTHKESDIAAFFYEQLQQDDVTNDQLVSGRGIELLHQYFYDQKLSAAEICAQPGKHVNTLNQFSRFYGRACRQYCLSAGVNDSLIVSGGIAATHHKLVKCDEFLQEFENSMTHRKLLHSITIQLNPQHSLGLQGILEYCLLNI